MLAPALDIRIDSAWHRNGQVVLGPIQLSIAPGETVALRGASGIGKTTLLRIAAGLHRDFRGKCKVGGRVAMVFQVPALLPWRTLSENLEIACRIDRHEASAMLRQVGLDGMEQRFPHSLSLGQMRRVSLARAFAAHPALLLMDEPFVSLDDAAASDMMRLFEDLNKVSGPACLIVTHAQSEADRLANRSVRLSGNPARLEDA